MKKTVEQFKQKWLALSLASFILIACADDQTEEATNNEEDETEEGGDGAELASDELTLVTAVEEYGEVVKAVAIELPSSVTEEPSSDIFNVQTLMEEEGEVERTVIDTYVTEGDYIGEKPSTEYLVIELDTGEDEATTLTYILEEDYNVRNDLHYTLEILENIELENGEIEATEEAVSIENEYQQVVEEFEHLVFEPSSGEELDFYLFEPDQEEEAYPLVLFLHGNGERGDGNEMNLLGNEGAIVWAEPDQQENHPAFVLTPQAPIDGEEFFIWGAEPRNTSVKELLDAVVEEYPVDEDRIYAMGISMEAIGTWRLVENYTDTFAAAVTTAGTTNFENIDSTTNISPVDEDLLESYFSIPTWSFHAADDDVVTPDNIRELAEIAEEMEIGHFHYTEYEEGTVEPMGHFSWVSALQDDEMINWLFDQSR